MRFHFYTEIQTYENKSVLIDLQGNEQFKTVSKFESNYNRNHNTLHLAEI